MALLSFKKHPLTREWVLKFCNANIIKYGINFEKQKGVYRLFGIPLFFSNVKAKTVKKYAESIIRLYPSHDLYICCYSGAGEVFQLALRLPHYISKSNKKNPCIICTNKKLEQVFQMAIGDKFPIYVLPDLRCQFIDEPFLLYGKEIFAPLNRRYFTEVEQNIISEGAHYFESLVPHLNNLSVNSYPVNRTVGMKIKRLRNHLEKIAFLSPEADTLSEIPIEYWHGITIILKRLGYKVYLNAINPKYKTLDVIFINDLSYREAIELCSQSDLIIGLRSGFIELALLLNSPKSIIIYNKFRDSCVTKLTSKQALNGFSLKKLPIDAPDNIVEVLYDDYSTSTSLQCLITKVTRLNL